MSRGPDEQSSADAEEGKVLSPEELDISDDERVKQIGESRYVVSSGDPIAESGDEPAGQLESGTDDRRPGPEPEPETEEPQPMPAPEPEGSTTEPESTPDATESSPDVAELTQQDVHQWLAADLQGSNSRYGFDITATFDGATNQRRMVSNDVVTIFESLVTWYGQQIDRNTPVEEVLGILLMEANVPVRYPPDAVKRALKNAGMSPDDSIAEFVEQVEDSEGFQL